MINYEIPHNESSYEEHIIAIHLKEVISDKTAQKIRKTVFSVNA